MHLQSITTCLVAGALTTALAASLSAQKGPSPQQRQAIEFEQSPVWRNFVAQTGGKWRMSWSAATGTPKAIWGTGIGLVDWRENTLEEARRHASLLFREQADLLGFGESDFREVIGARMGRTWSLVYDQYFRGLPVIDGRADVRINMVGRVAMFGSTAFQIPTEFVTVPTLLAETASAIAWQSLTETHGGLNMNNAAAAPRLVIWGDVHAKQLVEPQLAWEVAVDNFSLGAGRVGRYYIDAHTGAVLHFGNDRHECSMPGCSKCEAEEAVKPVATASVAPAAIGNSPGVTVTGSMDNPLSLPTNVTVTIEAYQNRTLSAVALALAAPLKYIDVDVQGLGTYTTNSSGQITINISGPTVISFPGLDGRHHQLINGSSNPALTSLIMPSFGTSQTVTIGNVGTISMNAHATTSYWTDRTNEFCRSILGNTPQLNTASNIDVFVNDTTFPGSGCGASYTTPSNIMRFSGGNTVCQNAAVSTIIAHEWGHGLDDRYGGVSNSYGDGLSEAWGDIVALYLVDDSELGLHWIGSGSVRSGNNTRQFTSLNNSTPVHDAGEVFMGFAWKLRNRLATTLGSRAAAISVSNDIVIGSIVADAIDQPGAVLEIFLADDNDGNLGNGTPHLAELIHACNQHSLPFPIGPANDDCVDAIPVTVGTNGPFFNNYCNTSSPAWPCGNVGSDVWFSYTANTPKLLTVATCGLAAWDTTIEVFSGTCGALTSLACNDDFCLVRSQVSVPVLAGTYLIRVGGFEGATGQFSLDVSTSQGANSLPFGSGCGLRSKAFYELIGGNAFDLNGTAMQLVNLGSHYSVQAGGSYVAPSASASTLSLSDDDEAGVNLTGSFPYPGGTTSALVVCSNGFVSPAYGNGISYNPNINAWLGSSEARWGTWHDFNLSAGGSAKFEQIGSVAYVTWDGAISYSTNDANTWQLQFDLTTGNVTFVWESVVASGSDWLVGYTSGTGDQNAGGVDLSVAVPATFQTAAINAAPLELDATAPVLGSNCLLTTTEVPPTGVLAIQALSLTQHNPGISVAFLGMPGCTAYGDLDAMYVIAASGGMATYSLVIPNQANLAGFQLTAQTSVFDPTANAFGFINSNGVLLSLGY